MGRMKADQPWFAGNRWNQDWDQMALGLYPETDIWGQRVRSAVNSLNLEAPPGVHHGPSRPTNNPRSSRSVGGGSRINEAPNKEEELQIELQKRWDQINEIKGGVEFPEWSGTCWSRAWTKEEMRVNVDLIVNIKKEVEESAIDHRNKRKRTKEHFHF